MYYNTIANCLAFIMFFGGGIAWQKLELPPILNRFALISFITSIVFLFAQTNVRASNLGEMWLPLWLPLPSFKNPLINLLACFALGSGVVLLLAAL